MSLFLGLTRAKKEHYLGHVNRVFTFQYPFNIISLFFPEWCFNVFEKNYLYFPLQYLMCTSSVNPFYHFLSLSPAALLSYLILKIALQL